MRFLSLFAGIGGFDLGLERAGMKCVGQVENDPYCIRVLEKHWPDVKRWGDIKDVTEETLADAASPNAGGGQGQQEGQEPPDGQPQQLLPDTGDRSRKPDAWHHHKGDRRPHPAIDLICGGFPCQPWSAAGKRGGTEDDRDLWPEMLRIIEAVRPNWVIGENVRNFVSMEMGLDRSISDLENIGYAVQPLVIPACAVDAPHRRDRVWIVAHNDRQQRGADSRKPNAGADWGDNIVGSGENVADADCGGGAVRRDGQLPATSQVEGRGPDNGGRAEEYVAGQRWLPEPDVGRVAHGVPKRVDRLKCLGNAVVPQVVERIGCAILEAEERQ